MLVRCRPKILERHIMQNQTEAVITACIESDPTIKKDMAFAALAILRGEGFGEPPTDDVIISRNAAAKELRVTPVTITNWCKQGLLKPVRVPGRFKALGVLKSSIDAIKYGRNG